MASVSTAATEENVVDELHLMVFPIVLGRGKRLFADGADARSLNLVESRQSRSVAILTLSRDR
jgi:dihydrofolate reductase